MLKNSKIDTKDLENVTGGQLTSEQAYQTALKHANKKRSQVRLKKNEFEIDDGISKYEIKFLDGFTEYEYEIDANSGQILKYEQENEFWD